MDDDGRAGEGDEDVNHLRDMAFEAPVVRLVNLLIENAISSEASDIHIEPFEDTLRIRYRIDGMLYEQEAPPRRLQAAVTSRIKIMAEMNIAERRLPQDGRIKMTLHGRRVDIRVSTMPTVHGESIVMRLLERSSVFHAARASSASRATPLKRFESLIKRPHGILLVTGPTGSGKTTTLYAALDKINAPGLKIITVEDPVEYQLKGVNQIQVKPKIGLTLRAAGCATSSARTPTSSWSARSATWRRPRSPSRPSLTGHLVFSTLHTNDAPGAITRLLDMGVEPYLVASVLEGVLAQRLVRPHLPGLPGARHAVPGRPRALGIDGAPSAELYRGKGCDDCRGDRVPRAARASTSCSSSTRTPAASCSAAPPTRDIRQHAIQRGMVTLRMDGWQARLRGRHHGRGDPPGHAGRRLTPCPSSPTGQPTGAGRPIDGVMEAADARAVVERLRKEAYFPIKVAAQGERAALLRAGGAGGSRVRHRDLLALTQMLATLFEAGLPLDRALAILEELAASPRMKTIVTDLLHSVRGGSSLSEALAKHHPRPFSRLYINMVRAGEKGGVLEVSLRRLAEFLEARAAFNEAVVSALAYPLVITVVGAAAIVFLHDLRHPALRRPSSTTSGRRSRCRRRSSWASARP